MKSRIAIVSMLGLVAASAIAIYMASRPRGGESTLSVEAQETTLGASNALSNRTRVLVAPGDPVRGGEEVLVTLVEFCDFRTPKCKHTARTLFESVLDYPQDVRVVFKVVAAPGDADSMAAAEAALAAHEQGKFWQMHDLLFQEPERSDRASLEDKAQRLGLDMTRFRAALDGHTYMPAIEASTAYASKVGVDSVPALFLNGLRIEDAAQPFVHLKPRIEAEIKRARAFAEEKGMAGADLYRELMREARPYSRPLATKSGETVGR